MNNEQRQLVELLDAAMRGNKINLRDNINWKYFLDEAKDHKVESLTYSALKQKEKVDNDVLEQWKKETFFSGINQVKHINQISYVLGKFNEKKIPVLVLKGLVVRDIYPNPQLRTMCDADILVKKENIQDIRELLINMGYIETESSDVHLNFWKSGTSHIEVHWTLTNEAYFENIPEFATSVWDDAVNVKVGDSNTLSMCDEDLALHLCIHMAAHMIDRGFGIRQICDLVLLVEKKGNTINWKMVMKKAKKCGVEKFVISIFNVSNKLFKMDIPKEISNYKVNQNHVDLLIEDILSSGVHGKKDMTTTFANELAYDGEDNKSVLSRFIKFLFPRIHNLSEKYNYAKKYKILSPIAWIHHLFAGVFNKEYSVIDKFKFATSALSISKKRNKLIQWLEL